MPGTILGTEHIIAKKQSPCFCALCSWIGEREWCGATINAIERKKQPIKGAFFYKDIHIHITNRELLIGDIIILFVNSYVCKLELVPSGL